MNEMMTYLLNLALDNHIGFELLPKAKPDWPSFAMAKKRKIFININWYNKQEIPFQIAHEISHLLNNDQGIQYYSSPNNKSKLEGKANATAVDIFIEYYRSHISDEWINPVKFMELFGIPQRLEYTVTNKINAVFRI